MSQPSLGTWLRQERERRGISLKTISDQTKISAPLLEGLEADNLARWPDGIYRRAFVRAYSMAIGLDADEVCRRFEQEHGAAQVVLDSTQAAPVAAPHGVAPAAAEAPVAGPPTRFHLPKRRARVLGTAADLTVAVVLAMGSAAAGSRLLWPVLLIAAYYALGILLTGTSPMVALLQDEPVVPASLEPEAATDPVPPRGVAERRHQPRRNGPRAARSTRGPRPRVQ